MPANRAITGKPYHFTTHNQGAIIGLLFFCFFPVISGLGSFYTLTKKGSLQLSAVSGRFSEFSEVIKKGPVLVFYTIKKGVNSGT